MKIQHSIRAKMTLLMLALTGGAVLLLLLINNQFLEVYYSISKQNTLENAYLNMCELVQSDKKEEQIALELESMCQKFNITYIILDSSTGLLKPVYYNVNNAETLQDLVMPYLFGMYNNASTLKKEEQYSIFKNEDARFHATYLELYGVEPNTKEYMLLRIPVESIRESVDISNRFLVLVGIVVVVIAVVLSTIIMKRFIKPLLELAELSEKMSGLDFEAKYERHDKDEIGVLGQSMNRLSEKLEATISELKSANNELQKDIEQKVQIDEMRKEFLSNVSHELKTPIALIQGYAEGLAEGIDDDDMESRAFYCDVIMDEADKMNKMVKKLLTLNQLEFGQEQTVMERFDMTAMIHGVLQSVDILCKQSDIQIEFMQEEPVYVWGDEYQLEEVVTNYVSNAIHYALGEKLIRITMEKREHTLRITVFNTGNPIPEEDIQKVWIKFYKVDKARTREYGGNGIGLSIVKAIMDAHHKEFGVRNVENGVEFWFEADCETGI